MLIDNADRYDRAATARVVKIEKAKNRAQNITPVIRRHSGEGRRYVPARRGDGSRSSGDQDAVTQIHMAGGSSERVLTAAALLGRWARRLDKTTSPMGRRSLAKNGELSATARHHHGAMAPAAR